MGDYKNFFSATGIDIQFEKKESSDTDLRQSIATLEESKIKETFKQTIKSFSSYCINRFFSFDYIKDIFVGGANYLIAIFPVLFVSFSYYGFSKNFWKLITSSNELFYASCIVCFFYFLDLTSMKKPDSNRVFYCFYYILFTVELGFILIGLASNIQFTFSIIKTAPNINEMIPFLHKNKNQMIIAWAIIPFVFLTIQRGLKIYLEED